MKQPIAYLRRSSANPRRPGSISHEAQLSAVRELAGADADRLLVLEDWGRSGRAERVHLRGEYARLRAMVAAGEVSTLYSYSLSRLARSTRELLDLAQACREADVPIRLCKEGVIDAATATGRLTLTLLAAVASWEAELAQERATEAAEIRRTRGDRLGAPRYGSLPGEDVGAVVAAYDEAGSYFGAARRLTARGVPTRRGAWHVRTVAEILQRERPDLIPRQRRQGARARGPHRLSGLLVCQCGATLSTMPRPAPQAVRYVCERAKSDPGHPRPYIVSERKILPWVMTEAARLRTPDAVEQETRDETQRAALGARRQRVIDNYEDGLIDKRERDVKIAAIVGELERLDATRAIVLVPEIDWAWSARELNGVLRALWDHIELGPDLRPIRAEWLVPEWRATDDPLHSAATLTPGNRP